MPFVDRLVWGGGRGVASSNGVLIELRACPLPMPVLELDFYPGAHVFHIRGHAESPRDMTEAERLACASILARCTAAARAALSIPESLP